MTTTALPRPHLLDLARINPLTGRRVAARLVVFTPLVVLVAGVSAVAVTGAESRWAALLSGAVPGLGQLVQGRILVGALTLVVLLVVLALTFLRSGGGLLLLLVPWAVTDAATFGSRWSYLVALLVGVVGAVTIEVVTRSTRERRIARFRTAQAATPTTVTGERSNLVPRRVAPPPPVDRYVESYLRYLTAFGHSAPDDWTVFDDKNHLDSALRYQLVLAGWALYHQHTQHTPAFRQSAGTSLRNLAERGRDHRVWSYTTRENLKGLRIDGDPFARENVMYSGYLANVLSMYEAVTGDDRYDRPGGYTVASPRREYVWDHTAIISQLALQHAISPMGSISCFPGWVFPPCQTFSLRAIQLADLVHGTDHGYAVERFLDALPRYFLDERGKVDTSRHVTGFAHPVDHLIVGLTGQAATGLFASAFDREVMQANYEHQVRARMRPPDADGSIELELTKMDTYDTSYGWNPGQPYSFALLYAAEFGDAEAIEGLRGALLPMLTPDAARPGPGSIVSMAVTFMALINSENAIAAGHRWAACQQTTPELESAPYPDVIVTRAVTDARGVEVDLIEGPGLDGPVELTFARLAPGREHDVVIDGAPRPLATTNEDGRLRVSYEGGRASILIQPRGA